MDSFTTGVNSMYANSFSSGITTNPLEEKIKNGNLKAATEEQLMEVCKDFESYFMEQMLKSMVKMADIDGDGSTDNMYSSMFGLTDSSDSGMNTMASFYGDEMVSKMAKQISDSKGTSLGLAQQLFEQMKRNYGIVDAPKSAAKSEAVNGTSSEAVGGVTAEGTV